MKTGTKRKRKADRGVSRNTRRAVRLWPDTMPPIAMQWAWGRISPNDSETVRRWRDWVRSLPLSDKTAQALPEFMPAVIKCGTFAEALLVHHMHFGTLGLIRHYFGDKHLDGDVLTMLAKQVRTDSPSRPVFEWLCREKGMLISKHRVKLIARMGRIDIIKLLCERGGIKVYGDDCVLTQEEVTAFAGIGAIMNGRLPLWRWVWDESPAFARPIRKTRILWRVRAFAAVALHKGFAPALRDVARYILGDGTVKGATVESVLRAGVTGGSGECLSILYENDPEKFDSLDREVVWEQVVSSIQKTRLESYQWLCKTYPDYMRPPSPDLVHDAIRAHGYTPLLEHLLDAWPVLGDELRDHETLAGLGMTARIKYVLLGKRHVEGLCKLHKRGVVQCSRVDVARLYGAGLMDSPPPGAADMGVSIGALIGMTDPSTWDLTKPLSEWQ